MDLFSDKPAPKTPKNSSLDPVLPPIRPGHRPLRSVTIPPGNIAPHAQHASHEFWSENRMMIPKMFVNQNLQLLKKRNLSDLSHLLKTAGLVQNPPFYPEPSGPPKTEQRP